MKCSAGERGLVIFRCASDDRYFAAHAAELGEAERELALFMRACGTCSSWAWHAQSQEAREVALILIALAGCEEPATTARPQQRRAA